MPDTLVRSKSLYRQLGSRLEAKILSGEFVAGDRLPTTQELATQFGVTIRTAQQAAAVLNQRGLIERIPGRGTFVSRRILSRTIGIIASTNVFVGANLEFFQHVYGDLCAELKRLGWHAALYFPTDEHATEQMLAELGQDAAGDRLRGVIVLIDNGTVSRWLKEHPSLAYAAGTSIPLIHDPHADTVYRGVAYLLDCGYRRLAVVAHRIGDSRADAQHLEANIAAVYAERGLPMTATLHGGHAASHADGMAQARAILDGPGDVPEAFLVLNDQGCAGVIFEVMRRKLDIPADVGVMAVANKDIAIPCPVPLTRLESDPADYAYQMIEGVLARIEGRTPHLTPITPALIVGESCGEGRKGNG
jgi:DNA-binding LacI/PurR family transcriptional regulator